MTDMMTLETNKKIACPVTGRPSDYYCRKDGAAYYVEKRSKVFFQHPMPTVSEMESFADEDYSEGTYKSYSAARNLKILTCEGRLKAFKKFRPGKRLLDVGCSCGFFLETAAND